MHSVLNSGALNPTNNAGPSTSKGSYPALDTTHNTSVSSFSLDRSHSALASPDISSRSFSLDRSHSALASPDVSSRRRTEREATSMEEPSELRISGASTPYAAQYQALMRAESEATLADDDAMPTTLANSRVMKAEDAAAAGAELRQASARSRTDPHPETITPACPTGAMASAAESDGPSMNMVENSIWLASRDQLDAVPNVVEDALDEPAAERQRRIEWIKYYVQEGRLQEAFDLGWDGE